MITAESVARHFIFLASRMEEPTPLTHMQVQKLVYYAQGWSLAHLKRPLFRDRLEAWTHGPVVDRVYQEFKRFGRCEIDPSAGREAESLDSDEAELIRWVWNRYNRYSAPELRRMTHGEEPWKDAWGNRADDDRSRVPISETALASYFSEQGAREANRIGLDLKAMEASTADARAGRTTPLDLSEFRKRGDSKRAG
ncbi:MAG: SocA family protein [Planctomycetes bacterium]|nr:SocA family protein [Planctomycetota bacterium]